MKRFSEEFHKKALTVKLRAAERASLRERVVSYIEYHPLPVSEKRMLTKSERALLSEPYRTVSFSWRQLLSYGGATTLLLVAMISYSAEQAIPGDALYPVKVKFNEEVRSSLTLSPYQKVTWETERLNRRIAEARVLASEGKLTTEVEAEVVAAVRSHSAEARREIAALQITDKDEAGLAALHLATALDVQSAALRQTEGGEEAESAATLSFSATVATEAGQLAAETTNPIAAIASAVEEERRETTLPVQDTLPSFERLLAHAESDTTRARELLASIDGVASAEEIREVTRRIEDVERLMARALETRASDESAAQALLTDVISRSQKLIVFMTNIDVRAVLSVEALVPVERTDEEIRFAIADATGRVRSLRAQIETALISTTITPEVAERIAVSSEQVEALLAASTVAEAGLDLVAAEARAREALGIVTDVAAMLGLTAEVGSVAPLLPEEVVATSTPATTTPAEEVEEGESLSSATTSATSSQMEG
jgi:hypothetical protein